MYRKITPQEIEDFPAGVLRLAGEVSDLLEDIRTGAASQNASQIPLFIPRIGYLKKKLGKKETDAQSMIESILSDNRFINNRNTVTATLEQQLVIIKNDLKTLDEVEQTLKDAGNKLSEVKVL